MASVSFDTIGLSYFPSTDIYKPRRLSQVLPTPLHSALKLPSSNTQPDQTPKKHQYEDDSDSEDSDEVPKAPPKEPAVAEPVHTYSSLLGPAPRRIKAVDMFNMDKFDPTRTLEIDTPSQPSPKEIEKLLSSIGPLSYPSRPTITFNSFTANWKHTAYSGIEEKGKSRGRTFICYISGRRHTWVGLQWALVKLLNDNDSLIVIATVSSDEARSAVTIMESESELHVNEPKATGNRSTSPFKRDLSNSFNLNAFSPEKDNMSLYKSHRGRGSFSISNKPLCPRVNSPSTTDNVINSSPPSAAHIPQTRRLLRSKAENILNYCRSELNPNLKVSITVDLAVGSPLHILASAFSVYVPDAMIFGSKNYQEANIKHEFSRLLTDKTILKSPVPVIIVPSLSMKPIKGHDDLLKCKKKSNYMQSVFRLSEDISPSDLPPTITTERDDPSQTNITENPPQYDEAYFHNLIRRVSDKSSHNQIYNKDPINISGRPSLIEDGPNSLPIITKYSPTKSYNLTPIIQDSGNRQSSVSPISVTFAQTKKPNHNNYHYGDFSNNSISPAMDSRVTRVRSLLDDYEIDTSKKTNKSRTSPRDNPLDPQSIYSGSSSQRSSRFSNMSSKIESRKSAPSVVPVSSGHRRGSFWKLDNYVSNDSVTSSSPKPKKFGLFRRKSKV